MRCGLILFIFILVGCTATTTPATKKSTTELANNTVDLVKTTSTSAGRTVEKVKLIAPSTQQSAALASAEETKRDADAALGAANLVPPAAIKDANHAIADDEEIKKLKESDPLRSFFAWAAGALVVVGAIMCACGLGFGISILKKAGPAIGLAGMFVGCVWYFWAAIMWTILCGLILAAVGFAIVQLVHQLELRKETAKLGEAQAAADAASTHLARVVDSITASDILAPPTPAQKAIRATVQKDDTGVLVQAIKVGGAT